MEFQIKCYEDFIKENKKKKNRKTWENHTKPIIKIHYTHKQKIPLMKRLSKYIGEKSKQIQHQQDTEAQ